MQPSLHLSEIFLFCRIRAGWLSLCIILLETTALVKNASMEKEQRREVARDITR